MSGGSLCDYQQSRIRDIIESIEEVINDNKKEKSREELFSWDFDEDGNVEEKYRYYYNFSDKTIKEFKKGIEYLKKAYIYAQRIDWLVSGDDGEEEFHKRLKEDLEKNEV